MQTPKYTAVRGKLNQDDAREAYVTGPCDDGSVRPIASFYRFEEAVLWAAQMAAAAEAQPRLPFSVPPGDYTDD